MFDEMPDRDLVSWNVMIKEYVRNRNLGKAREMFKKMSERDVCSWNGCVDEARRIFDRMPEKNEACVLFESRENWALVSWKCLLGGFLKKKKIVEARRFLMV
ncbi:Pentatricopeptide repeat-containing protein [Raphanus sativus]|nr:Pentatricopeptide repeat-containing protein [Raphanus sativus]